MKVKVEYNLAMSASKKNIFYALVAAILFIAQNSIIHSVCADEVMVVPEQKVQVRVFVDMGMTVPEGGRSDFLQVYGIRIEPDGSEKVVWRLPLAEWDGLLENTYYYEYLYFDETVYLFFPYRGKQFPFMLQLNRDTGALIRKIGAFPREIIDLRRKYSWSEGVITLRPGLEKPTLFTLEGARIPFFRAVPPRRNATEESPTIHE